MVCSPPGAQAFLQCPAMPPRKRPMGDLRAQQLDTLVTKMDPDIQKAGVQGFFFDDRRDLIMNLPQGCGELALNELGDFLPKLVLHEEKDREQVLDDQLHTIVVQLWDKQCTLLWLTLAPQLRQENYLPDLSHDRTYPARMAEWYEEEYRRAEEHRRSCSAQREDESRYPGRTFRRGTATAAPPTSKRVLEQG